MSFISRTFQRGDSGARRLFQMMRLGWSGKARRKHASGMIIIFTSPADADHRRALLSFACKAQAGREVVLARLLLYLIRIFGRHEHQKEFLYFTPPRRAAKRRFHAMRAPRLRSPRKHHWPRLTMPSRPAIYYFSRARYYMGMMLR